MNKLIIYNIIQQQQFNIFLMFIYYLKINVYFDSYSQYVYIQLNLTVNKIIIISIYMWFSIIFGYNSINVVTTYQWIFRLTVCYDTKSKTKYQFSNIHYTLFNEMLT